MYGIENYNKPLQFPITLSPMPEELQELEEEEPISEILSMPLSEQSSAKLPAVEAASNESQLQLSQLIIMYDSLRDKLKEKEGEVVEYKQHCLMLQEKLKESEDKVNELHDELKEANKSLNELDEYKRQLKSLQQERKLRKPTDKVKTILLMTRQWKYIPFHKLTVLGILGQGSNGIVFLVEVDLKGRKHQFALKMIMNYNQASSTNLRNLYCNEYEILDKIKDIHPNIINILANFTATPTNAMINMVDPKIRDHVISNGVPIKTMFFVIEYHPHNLKELLLRKKASVEEVYRYAKNLFSCFKFLYDNYVVHRDAKLDNILVAEDGSLILSDFGESIETDENHCCLQVNLKAGNPQHTAPEVLRDRKNGSGSALIDFTKQYSWDVGCLLYEIIFEKFPYPNYPMEKYNLALDIAYPSSISPQFINLIVKLLQELPSDRISIVDAQNEFNKNCFH